MSMEKRSITLGECDLEIIGGQIMSRITSKGDSEEGIGKWRVVVPKCIQADGSIDDTEMPEEVLVSKPDPKRVTELGDIVMKLSTPYDAACVEEGAVGCIIPSFCAIIKSTGKLNRDYLLAFLNSNTCKTQLKLQVAGSTMAMLSVGKVKNITIPVPPMEVQERIGNQFNETRRKVQIAKKIILLEQKKNDIYFRDLEKEYED